MKLSLSLNGFVLTDVCACTHVKATDMFLKEKTDKDWVMRLGSLIMFLMKQVSRSKK